MLEITINTGGRRNYEGINHIKEKEEEVEERKAEL
jgi:hypothetical protein